MKNLHFIHVDLINGLAQRLCHFARDPVLSQICDVVTATSGLVELTSPFSHPKLSAGFVPRDLARNRTDDTAQIYSETTLSLQATA